MNLCRCGHTTGREKHPDGGPCGAWLCECDGFLPVWDALPETIGTIVIGQTLPPEMERHDRSWRIYEPLIGEIGGGTVNLFGQALVIGLGIGLGVSLTVGPAWLIVMYCEQEMLRRRALWGKRR